MPDPIPAIRRQVAAGTAAALVAAVALVGCAHDAAVPALPVAATTFTVGEMPVDHSEIDAAIEPAPDVVALVAGYRERLGEQLAEVLGYATADFFKADPEGALDNLVADALLEVAQDLASDTVHVVLLNDGGLRVPLGAGAILMRNAFELLPFENYVTVLSLSGAELERLADEIALTNGEPIAGWTMVLDGDDAVGVRVGGQPIDPEATYRLATVDYLANGGGTWPLLWEVGARGQEELHVLIRDVFVTYLRSRDTVSPSLDGRVRRAGPGPDADGSSR